MDELYKEIDELTTELEKLKEDYRIKTELSENLRRAHSDQLVKNQEAQLQIEKQSKELNEKSEELAEIRQDYEEAKIKLRDMELSVKQVSSVNEKIRIDTGEKVQKLEVENKKLVSAYEEATGRNDVLETKLGACNKEIEGLKSLPSESQRKCLEAEEKARAGRELKHREEVISKLEEESMSVQDQLKWKKEQFCHLEEAHTKLQDLFQSSKKEWTLDKTNMLEEMARLQSKLDSQIRISEGLESRLKMCNQALAHEESRRKALEVQLSESKQCFNNILAEYEDAKALIESFSTKRDEDIASLRNSIGMKEILLKEMEYKVTHLEQDNKELLGSLKELREAQINKRKVDPTLNKIRNKLKDLEQVHGNCSQAWKEREAEWNTKMEKLMGDMKCYESDLERQSKQMNQLKIQLDECRYALEVSGEESSILLLMMQSELSNAYSKPFKSVETDQGLTKENAYLKCKIKETEHKIDNLQNKITYLDQKLLEKAAAGEELKLEMVEAIKRAEQLGEALKERDSTVENLRRKIEAMEEQSIRRESTVNLEKEELYRNVTQQKDGEIKGIQNFALSLERDFRDVVLFSFSQGIEDLVKIVALEDALGRSELLMTSEMERKNVVINVLKEEVNNLKNRMLLQEELKLGMVEANKKAEQLCEALKERDSTVEDLQRKIEDMKEQSIRKESAVELEREELYKNVMQQKDEEIRGVQNFALSSEQDFMYMVLFSFSQGIEDLVKIMALEDALGRSELVMTSEMERKNVVIDVLKEEVSNLKNRMLLQEELKLGMVEANKKAEQLCEALKERDSTVEDLRRKIEDMKEQSIRRESAVEYEKEELYRNVMQQKDEEIRGIQNVALSLEREYMDVILFSFSQGIEDHVKIVALEDALGRSELVMTSEIERKNGVIDVLKEEVSNLKNRMLLQEELKLGMVEANKKAEQLCEALKERDSTVEDFRRKIEDMKEQSIRRESAVEYEKEELYRNVMQQKDEEIRGIQNVALSLEREYMDVILFSFSQGIEDHVKIVALEDALGRSELVMTSEIERKNGVIDVLKEEVSNLKNRMLLQEELKLGMVEANKKAEQLCEALKERDSTVEDFRRKIEDVKEQSIRRESAVEYEKEELYRNVMQQKDEEIRGIQNVALSLEREYMDVILFSFSQGIEDHVKIVALEDALGRSELVMTSEIERKNGVIDVLKEEVSNLKNKMLLQEESLACSQKSVKELEDLIEVNKIETRKVLNQLREQQTKLKEMVESLKQEREAALATIEKLSLERDKLLAYVEEACEQFGEFCSEDAKLEALLGKLLQNSDQNDLLISHDVIIDKLCNSAPRDVKKEAEATHDRSPLREINH